MDRSNNHASWHFKMGQPKPQCCENIGHNFQTGNASFWAFKEYVKKHKMNRNLVGGTFNTEIVPQWMKEP
tara:strand:+ start:374 stop:583 length:210 start_codon:yes stop_codon:yes gene_type:complete